MRGTPLFATAATLGAVLLTYATPAGQDLGRGSTFVAFRVDGTHAIATLKVIETSAAGAGGPTGEPAAQYGFRYFDAPAEWRAQVDADARLGERWLVHASAGQQLQAEAERIVGGSFGCQDAIGVLLRVAPESAGAFAALRARYFVAERAHAGQSPQRATGSAVGPVRSPSADAFKRALDATLEGLLARELPRVRADAEPDIARNASSPDEALRSSARQQRAIDEALQRGRGQLRYDVQSFTLSPDRVPVHFVRAQWMVDGQQGFAASLWVRGEQTLELVETNLSPAHWLRMTEFNRTLSREHLGLVLDVFDRDHDGWGEVLVAQGGYESMSLSLLEYSAGGFRPTGIEYAHGC